MNKFLAILMELGKAFNIPESKINELIPADTKVEDLDTDAINKAFGDAYREKMSSISKTHALEQKKAKDEGFKAAERTVKTDVEKQLKTALKLEDVSADTLEDLLDVVVNKYSGQSGKKAADLTDEDIKKHPAYITASKAWEKQVKEVKEAGEKALADMQSGIQKEKTFSTVAEKALAAFDELKPVLSSDPAKAANQRQSILQRLKGYEFEIVDGNVIIQKDGKVLQDAHLNNVKLSDLVKQEADPYFDFKVADERQSPNGDNGNNGNGGSGGGSGIKYTGALPKSKKELLELASDDKIPLDQRQELMKWGETAAIPE